MFLAIIGVWAAYLVPHWLSRRDDLAQSRTPDRFSGGLRVLQRRSRKPLDRAGHRSGDAVLTSPRVVVDADGEYLYIPADRALAARAEREAAAAEAAEAAAEIALAVAAEVAVLADDPEFSAVGPLAAESAAPASASAEPAGSVVESATADPAVTSMADAVVSVDESVVFVSTAVAEPAVEPVAAGPTGAEPVVAEAAGAPSEGVGSGAARPATGEPTFAELTATRPGPNRRGSTVVTDPTPIAVSDPPPVEITASAYAPSRTHTAPASSRTGRPAPPAPAPAALAPSTPEVEMPERPFDLEIAIGIARLAARRRAVIMAVLFVLTVASWVVAASSTLSAWVAAPATALLVLHVLASRVAGLRSRETLMLLAVQVHSAELVQARPQRQYVTRSHPADVAAPAEPVRPSERVARRAAAVGAQTWDPIPVPPPTYTLKPAAHRPEPAPLERPAAAQAAPPAAAVSRGALPRRAADIERILALESHLDELFEEPKVVNG